MPDMFVWLMFYPKIRCSNLARPIGVQPKPAVSKSPTRIGNMGHLTRLANRINQASTSNANIQGHVQVYIPIF